MRVRAVPPSILHFPLFRVFGADGVDLAAVVGDHEGDQQDDRQDQLRHQGFQIGIDAKHLDDVVLGNAGDAQGQVDVDVIENGRHYYGSGISTDVIEASALALISAANSLYRTRLIEEREGGKRLRAVGP